MKKTFTLALAVIIVCALGLCVYVLSGGRGSSRSTAAGTQQQLSVAAVARDLAPGEFLESRDLTWAEWTGKAEDAVDFFAKGKIKLEELEGAILRVPLHKGNPLSGENILQPGESDFLSAVLRSGFRAFTIQVDDVTGGAGLIRPGNRVDVVLSGKFGVGPEGTLGFDSAQTLLRGIRVIAVNRDFERTGLRPQGEEQNARAQRNRKGTVTLEVSPKQVEVLTVARSAGTLSLSLCDLAESSSSVQEMDSSPTTAAEFVPLRSKRIDRSSPRSVVTYYGTAQEQR